MKHIIRSILILFLVPISNAAFASQPISSNVFVILNGPTWHASSTHYNWKTFGAGIGYQWQTPSNSVSIGVGGYDNSHYNNSYYIAAQYLHGSGVIYGFTAGFVTGYPCGHTLPLVMADVGYKFGGVTMIVGAAPKTSLSPTLVNVEMQFSM